MVLVVLGMVPVVPGGWLWCSQDSTGVPGDLVVLASGEVLVVVALNLGDDPGFHGPGGSGGGSWTFWWSQRGIEVRMWQLM